MFVTRLFSSSLRHFLWGGTVAYFLVSGETSRSQAVSSQANTDASAQRRLQEIAREADRQRRIDEQIRNLAPALDPGKLAGTEGPILTRKALAALVHLREEGIPPQEAMPRAVRSAGIDPTKSAKPSTFLRNLFLEYSPALNAEILKKLEVGEDPGPKMVLPLFQP
ncbi:hypothetical protein EBT23_03055 [bacterium]|nr:hypothetical protein [bacterium]